MIFHGGIFRCYGIYFPKWDNIGHPIYSILHMKSEFLSPVIFVQILHIYVVFKVIDAFLYGSDVQIMHIRIFYLNY